MWKSYPITGFAADIDPTTDPGALYVGTKNFLPTVRGITPGPVATPQSGSLSSVAVWGAKVLQKNDATLRYWIGTNTALYEYASGAFTNRSSAVYSGASSMWDFTQFGDVTLAVRSNTQIQQISSGAAFAAVTGAPTANIMVTCGPPASPFVMVFDYTPSGGGSRVYNGWKCSALSDYTSWTDSLATQAASGQLVEPTGPFTAAFAFRDGVVAFKQRGMYVGEYVGNPGNGVIWAWRRVSDSVGCVGKNAGCVFNDVLYFADHNGLWMFDGGYPRPMPGHVHKWFRDQHLDTVDGLYMRADDRNRLIYCYNSVGDYGLAFSGDSGLWTPLSNVTTTDSLALGWLMGGIYCVVSDGTTARVATLGAGVSATQTHELVTGLHGSDVADTLLRGVRFKTRSMTATGTFYGANTLQPQTDGAMAFDTSVTPAASENKMDGRVTGRYVYVHAVFTTGGEITGVSYDLEQNGAR
jgi:hypothetical protein